MRKIFVLSNFALFLFSSNVFASDYSCKPSPEFFPSARKCHCGKNLTGIYNLDQSNESRIRSSSKLPLVKFCPYFEADEPSHFEGTYHFKGSAIVTGIVIRTESDSLGDTAEFSVDTKKFKNLLRPDYLLTSLRLGSNGFKNFHIPKLSAKHPCWEANAKVEIKRLNVNNDAGTDFGGNFLVDYKVLNVGKYRDCK